MKKHELLNLIASEINEWAIKNFTVHIPALGILEEIGEITHCVLKRYQGIRGFDDLTHFKNELFDAIADAGVYTLHSMAMKGILVNEIGFVPYFNPQDDNPRDQERAEHMLSHITAPAGRILDGYKSMVGGGCAHMVQIERLASFAATYKIDFVEAVAFTWANVQKRDWVKNKTDAHEQALGMQ